MSQYHRTFISHAHSDNILSSQLADALRARGIDIWIDLNNAQKGHDLSGDISRQLLTRSAFVLMLTTASDRSAWVGMELSNFIAFRNDSHTSVVNDQPRLILPVLLEMIHLGPDSNWARVYGVNWINAVGRNVNEVADEIANALLISDLDPEYEAKRRNDLDFFSNSHITVVLDLILLQYAIVLESRRDPDIAGKMQLDVDTLRRFMLEKFMDFKKVFNANEIADAQYRTGCNYTAAN